MPPAIASTFTTSPPSDHMTSTASSERFTFCKSGQNKCAIFDINFCQFRRSDNEMPKFHTWLFKTPTGITGILLLALIFLIYIFAIQYSRRHVFNAFWRTHNLYPILYILIVVHGLGKLIQPPIFYFYFLFPIVSGTALNTYALSLTFHTTRRCSPWIDSYQQVGKKWKSLL